MARIVTAEELLSRRARIVSAEDILRGASGRDGLNGVNGRDGLSGRDGQDGRDGLNGKDGQGFSWRGNWLASVDYKPFDVVNYLGSTFISVVSSRNKQPRANSPEWDLLAAAGSTGPAGPNNLFVGTEPPTDPIVGTVWIDTN